MARIAPSLLLTLAAALPSVALAGSPFDTVLGGAASAELPGPVDIPLYSAPWGGSQVGVFMTVGEERFFVQVLPGTASLYLDGAAVGKLGADVKAKEVNGTEYSYADVGDAKLGDVTLRGVRVTTTELEVSGIADAALGNRADGVSFDGFIGLGALTDQLSWALLRSEGVLRLAPAGQGGTLVSGIGGETAEVQVTLSEKYKFGKEKRWSVPGALVTDGVLGDSGARAVLAWSIRPSIADIEVALPDGGPELSSGDRVFKYTKAGLPGATEDTWVQHTSAFSYASTDDGPIAPHRAVIGLDVLEELDAAFDPSSNTFAYKRSDKPTYKDPLPELLAEAQADVDESLEPAEDAAADAEAPKGDPGAWSRLAAVKTSMGDLQGAVEALQSAAEVDEDKCEGWLALGSAQRIAGDLDGAKASLEKSADLFNTWWSPDIPLSPKYEKLDDREIELANRKHLAAKSRAEWSELIAKAEKKGVEPAELGVPEGLEPQGGASCATADSELAAVLMLSGSGDKVAELYAGRADWDGQLPLIAGNAALAAGDLDAAGAAYRQNSKVDLSTESQSRVGLAVVAAKQGRWDDGKKLMAQVNQSTQNLPDLQVWLSLRAEKDGAVGAAKEAAQLAAAQPDHAGTAVLWAEWAKAAGDEGRATEAMEAAKALTASMLRHDKSDAHAIALNARLALVSGDVAGARKGAERAVKLAPTSPFAHEALALVLAAEGDTAKATASMKKAAAAAPEIPYYAMQAAEK